MSKFTQKTVFSIFILFSTFGKISAQSNDTIQVQETKQDSIVELNTETDHLNYKRLIVPAALIGYGVASLSVKGIKQLNFSTRDEINEHKPDHIRLDNYTQFAPAALVYGLNAFGVEGKHNFRDRSIIYGTSMLITSAFVVPLKHMVKEERPDQSNNLSFPSGHTAIAFASAQFMFREYKDTNFWLGISGYSIAVFTGVYRMLNDKHWVGDVVGGAGFGILSTELAYWLYPKINHLIGGKNQNSATMVMPFYQNKSVGIGFVKTF
ncbi:MULTISPECIES: phosphatase PAP2 family protein [Chryseobacterium group]|uniref:PA-phosphatase n=3 Tax=Chryseobacterium group TaxID=2782232 RepID=A0A085B5W5_9FLAO|nr:MULTISPECIES: phosphatase PAP2 family protein [Chryseobacterium group]AZA89795.1 phosphatase PAP2 family protein [Chryseobacterium nakagawai]KFC17860.1 PA-phosphatase [Epilithonimonas lactis]SEQ77329.1 PAP2 superfamily protein [Epilithonimonas lactis]SMP11800.1 PAP2 superfamily protein [Chryseobacterium profundimaris]VEH21191.1 lipid A 1-phosphatase [Chryseobacterium nakagawai]